LIVNLRGMAREEPIITDFAEKTGTRVLAMLPFSHLVKESVGQAKTVFQDYPGSAELESVE
jgi:nitrogenase subunit NifH